MYYQPGFRRRKRKKPNNFKAQFDDSTEPKVRGGHMHRNNALAQKVNKIRYSKPANVYNLADKPLNYDEYLSGPYWLKLRKQILWTRNKWEECGTDRRLNLHHLYYYKHGKSVLYRERQYTDIFAVLCYPCHMKVHNACSQAVLGVRLNQSF